MPTLQEGDLLDDSVDIDKKSLFQVDNLIHG